MLASLPICRYQTLSALLNIIPAVDVSATKGLVRIVNENGIDKRSRKNVGAIIH